MKDETDATHEFTLIVEGPDLQDAAFIVVLFEAALDDANVGRVGTLQYVDFCLESEAFADAEYSATEVVE